MNQGYPIEIIKYNAKTKVFELNSQPLKEILLQDDVRDASITVIVVNGPSRKGKSFILNFMLKYLHETYTRNNPNWLRDENNPLTGFAWRGGSRRHTTGVWVWSKIFVKILPSGEKVGLMLMDTQGTYDGSSRLNESNAIYYLTTMLSSVNILNLSANINDGDLENFKIFVEYGKMIKEQVNENAFQSLLFLVRDWSYPYESSFGFDGGKNFLDKTLQITEDMDEEMIFTRTHIKNCCGKLQTYLMPTPGNSASTLPEFNGELKHLHDDFKTHLKLLIPEILAPEKIVTKRINHDPIKGKHFLAYLQFYWAVFKKGGEQTADNLLMVTTRSYFHNLKRDSVERYQLEMQKETADSNKSVTFSEIVRIHETNAQQCLNNFISKITFGDQKSRTEIVEKIKAELQDIFLLYAAANDSKQTNNLSQTMTNLTDYATNLENKTIEQSKLMEILKQNVDNVLQATEEEKNKLIQEIERLKREPLIVYEVGENKSLNDSIDEEVARWNQQIDKEVRRFGQRLRGDHDSIEDRLKEAGSRFDDDLKEFREDLEEKGKKIGHSIKNEVRRVRDKCSLM